MKAIEILGFQSMMATETIAAAIHQIDEKKENLKKAFDDLLQSHRSLLSPSFSLSWSEIDSHFSSLQSSLSTRFHLLQSASASEHVPHIIETAEAMTSSPEEEEAITIVSPELRTLCEKQNGIGLCKYLIDRWDDDSSLNPELSAAIRYSSDPASMVLDAIQGSYRQTPAPRKSFDVRRVFVLLMEALIENNAYIKVDVRERAKKLGYDWKTKIGVNKPFEALLFLHLVAAFELGSEFSSDEVSDYVFMIGKYKQATSVCNKIGLGSERVGNLIKKLLDNDKPILAVRFMYECGMSDGFEPVTVLKSYIKELRVAAYRICVEGNYSLKSQNEATDKEVSGLKAVIKIVKDENLESEFCDEKLEERVEELEKQKALRKRDAAILKQEPQKKGKKRMRNENGTQANPAMSQEQPFPRSEAFLVPGLQMNPFGLVNSAFSGGVVPYMNPLAGLYGSAAAAPHSVYYGQQNGFVLPGQYHPAYYPGR